MILFLCHRMHGSPSGNMTNITVKNDNNPNSIRRIIRKGTMLS